MEKRVIKIIITLCVFLGITLCISFVNATSINANTIGTLSNNTTNSNNVVSSKTPLSAGNSTKNTT